MTEAEWDACSDPQKMVGFLVDRSARKLRLTCCAACRRLWHLLDSSRLRDAIDALERYADGTIDEAAYSAAAAETHPLRSYLDELVSHSVREDRWYMAYGILYVMTSWRDGRSVRDCLNFFTLAADRNLRGEPLVKPCEIECAAQVNLIRDLFGNLFHPFTPSLAWLTWNDATVVRLAQAAYENRILPAGTLDNTYLAILADALEEAGCTEERILGHLRSNGEHYRGCFVIDALLGKS